MQGHRDQPRIPVSTYRLQFSGQFTFRQACQIIPYLDVLGISDIYSSPYLMARSGSAHGYDIVSHAELNPEVGTEDEYREMIRELSRRGMGQLLDIVPNHMCVHSNENKWWNDVLENGPSSSYACFFDIDWTPVKRELENKILMPILGDQYGNVLDRGELTVSFEDGELSVSYFEHRFPAEPKTYLHILEHNLETLRKALGEESDALMEFLSILTAIRNLPAYTDTVLERIEERQREKEVIKKRLAALYSESSEVRGVIEENVDVFSGRTDDESWLHLLDDFLGAQV
ncbi:MAG: alpha-amylase family glycosyl hydrolase, partial [Thermodesulfovibrionales bacterium]